MEKRLSKKDMILIITVLFVALLLFLIYSMTGKKTGSTITIKVDGEIQGTYSLSEEQEISINNGTNILKIQDGKADMTEADCPDKLCVNQKAISKNKENIICLPNKVVVEVDSDENNELDAVTN